MSASQAVNMPSSLHRRLLNDIAEIQQTRYPNIHLFIDDANLYKACLVLTPEGEDALHLTIKFSHDYPLRAPNITIQSSVIHPNVFGNYICATILNTTEGWTSAYTLKGFVIQLLSFFCSDSLEQDYGGENVNIAEYRRRHAARSRAIRNQQHNQWFDDDELPVEDAFSCNVCGFGPDWRPAQHEEKGARSTSAVSARAKPHTAQTSTLIDLPTSKQQALALPDEIILLVLAYLDTRDVFALADAVPTVKKMIHSYDFVRVRELQCFCLKESFYDSKLGIGVKIVAGRRPVFQSEFDLLSQEAFFQHNVRRSIQGVEFDKWLPLPLSRRHWSLVKNNATACLKGLHDYAQMHDREANHVHVLYHFMNSVVVQFSADSDKGFGRRDSRSTLNHASDKAVEAYFALFHLLLCFATANPAVVKGANLIVTRFLAGPRTKSDFPDLGHVLVASLISKTGLTEELTLTIIKEAILRNVVWMLDVKGAGMAELAYLEPSAVSDYRLVATFNASTTSYRLLMFLKLFSAAARPQNKSLVDLCEALFDTHSAPPLGVSTVMADRIRKIREIDGFPGFFRAMGVKNVPSKSEFTVFLRRTVTDSKKAGYSCMPMTQSQLYMIRKVRERKVEIAQGILITPDMEGWFNKGEKWFENGWKGRPTFFPRQSEREDRSLKR